MSSKYKQENIDAKVYVGDLSSYTSKQDVEDAFSYYGPIRNVWVARNPPGFAFVEFEDVRDAEDAIKEVDGKRTVCGRRVRVERAGVRKEGRGRGGGGGYRGGGGGRDGGRGGDSRYMTRRGRPFHPEDRCYECGDRGHYARDCNKFGRGSRGSAGRGGRSYSRSRSRSRNRSHSRSHSRNRSHDRSRSRSRSRGNRSHSRSKSRSNHRDSRDKRSNSHSDTRSRSRSRSHVKDKGSKNNLNGDT